MSSIFHFSTFRELRFFITRPWLAFRSGLDEREFEDDPIKQFAKWYDSALRCWSLEFPNAMCLSTLDPNGYPDGRIVLLKEVDSSGFVFFTNKLSKKGRSLAALRRASLTFYWDRLQRQVRIQGDITDVGDQESDQYFNSRPRQSQLGAWASNQSEVLENREVLTSRLKELGDKYHGINIPRPPHWGGYHLDPVTVEFWQLRISRLHDRIAYSRADNGAWRKQRLAP